MVKALWWGGAGMTLETRKCYTGLGRVSMEGCFMNSQALASPHLTSSPSSGPAGWAWLSASALAVRTAYCCRGCLSGLTRWLAGQKEGGLSWRTQDSCWALRTPPQRWVSGPPRGLWHERGPGLNMAAGQRFCNPFSCRSSLAPTPTLGQPLKMPLF